MVGSLCTCTTKLQQTQMQQNLVCYRRQAHALQQIFYALIRGPFLNAVPGKQDSNLPCQYILIQCILHFSNELAL